MNRAILVGRLTRDPEVRHTAETAVARFNLAVNRRYSKEGEQQADFISCVAFGKIAEFCEKYTKQGTKILVEGRIQTGSYTNRDGNKVYTTDIVVENVEFTEKKSDEESQPTSTPAPDSNGFVNVPDDISDEGLPFN